jgi:hypothetical protein
VKQNAVETLIIKLLWVFTSAKAASLTSRKDRIFSNNMMNQLKQELTDRNISSL